MSRTNVLKEIEEILQHYCTDCFLKKHFRKMYSKTYAHQFCINQCTVGSTLKEKGKELLNTEKTGLNR
ncbi:zinc-finger domain-containing protein [Siminovitchia sp. 179-K 8D1 HS]|uniref:zinc-finger domain-containing protein n=1 Tax=Siminovitchia sp. 179-K 8D1 HS TaxID=3142385 RepID=UPI0039A3BFB5